MTTVTKKQTSLAKILETRESRMGALIFLVMLYFHVGSLYVFKVGFTWTAFTIFLISYFVKITGITMGYHRLFAHRTFKAKRWFQFYLALAGSTAIQGGVLWWASHHRGHHQHSDLDEDLHSPITHSPLHAHLGWMWSKDCFKPTKHKMLDFARFPEIRFINRHYLVLILLQGLFFYGMGLALETWFPELETTGSQIFVWGFLLSTVWTWHITFSINSICHNFGSKRYESHDESRNNWIMSILAFGEGWHNNYHKYGWSARNGFFWWEWGPTWYMLKVAEKIGLVWDLKVPTKEQLRYTL